MSLTSKITKSARDKDCNLQIFRYCSHNPEQTVAAHIHPKGHGHWGMKDNDIFTIRACAVCHDIIDGRKDIGLSSEELDSIKLNGLLLTQIQYINEGLI